MSSPEISVIMPAYNHEKFVGEAIESVLNQSFEDFEFIIINDGSTDNTEKVIRSYNDRRIIFHSQQNKDAAFTINRGIALAKGKFISIINSDDVYHTERLKTIYEKISEREHDFVFTDINLIDDNSNIIKDEKLPLRRRIEDMKRVHNETEQMSCTFLNGNLTITTSNFFFKSDLIERIGNFKVLLKYLHDHEFILRVCVYNENCISYLADETLLNYRLHKYNTIKKSPVDARSEQYSVISSVLTNLLANEDDKENMEFLMHRLELIYGFWLSDYKGATNTLSWKITKPLRWLINKTTN